jgi:hypothetical protein
MTTEWHKNIVKISSVANPTMIFKLAYTHKNVFVLSLNGTKLRKIVSHFILI